MARMIGTTGQPPCKKCCGWECKADNQKHAKRPAKRREKAELRRDLALGRV